MTATINLGKVEIPVEEYASEGNAILGIRASGKSSTATYIAERLLDEGIPFVAFDPIGVWRYLRVPGQGKAYPVVVAGGAQPDLPLTAQSAPEIVRAAMRENISLVIDLYDINLSKADWKSIVEQCVRLLLYENGQYGLRHLFIEEAAEFVPQRVGPDQGRVYAEIEKLARMGGNALLGYTLINQRAEEVNKAVLELCDAMILHRQKGRNSLIALQKWLKVATQDTDSAKVIRTLPNLAPGEAWVWAPNADRPIQMQIPKKKTAYPDRRRTVALSGATHESALDVSDFVGRLKEALNQSPAKQARSAPRQQVADIHSQAESFSRRIAELEEALEHSFTEEQVQARLDSAIIAKDSEIQALRSAIAQALAALSPCGEAADSGQPLSGGQSPATVSGTYAPFNRVKRLEQQVEDNPRISKTSKRLFRTLVEEYPDFPQGMSKAKLAAMCKLKVTSGGGFNTPLTDLRDRRYVTIAGGGAGAIVAINSEML